VCVCVCVCVGVCAGVCVCACACVSACVCVCVSVCVCDRTWGWYWKPTTSSSTYKPSTNKDQKNTKTWVQCIPTMTASAFQRFDSLPLQSNKIILVNWLDSLNFSGFWCNSMWNVQYSAGSQRKVHKHVLLYLFSRVRNLRPFVIEQVQSGLLIFTGRVF